MALLRREIVQQSKVLEEFDLETSQNDWFGTQLPERPSFSTHAANAAWVGSKPSSVIVRGLP